MLEVGVFIPIANNGYLISTTAPQYSPTFAHNRDVLQTAERHGFDFALAMIKLRGYGGPTRHWEECLEAFTLMSAIAAVTERLRLFPSVAVLTMPPPMVARMAVTIDSVAPGRSGINIVSGWQMAEYTQMGLWPGEVHFRRRYEYCAEYARILRELLETGRSDFKGQFFQMDDCRLGPLPSNPIQIVCAGQSEAGMRFAAEYGDYNFITGNAINQPRQIAPAVAKLNAECKRTGRRCGALVLTLIIAEPTDAAAEARWAHYKTGTDYEALAWREAQAKADVTAKIDSQVERFKQDGAAVPATMVTLIGSYAKVAAMLDELASIEGVKGCMFVFGDYLEGVDTFGRHIQPLMRSRRR